jgi:hypothetical protein
MLRIRDVAAYLRITHLRVTQMYAEGKLPAPEQADGLGPDMEARDDRAVGRAGVVGDAAVAETAVAQPLARRSRLGYLHD